MNLKGIYRELPGISGRDGMTFILLSVTIVVIGLSSAVVAKSWSMAARMEKETELIWRGNQYRRAIEGYYKYRSNMHGGAAGAFYPTSIDDLLSDPGRVGYRWLRKKYKDPITDDDWVVIRTGAGIIGVHSSSTLEPLKRDNFSVENEDFIGKEKYAEWEFKYI